MRIFRRVLISLGVSLLCVMASAIFTTVQLNAARVQGWYASPEQGMVARAEQYYSADRQIKILHAGPNSFNGSKPFVWYVIAEVHASARTDGSELGPNGCDTPGNFFLQTKDGNWVYVPEGAFPGFMAIWMEVFGWAGEGQGTPSTNWAPDQINQFCQ
jgi:hypothetical protein